MSKVVRIICLIMVLAMIVTVSACADKGGEETTTTTTTGAGTTTTTTTGTTAPVDPFAEHLELSYMGPGVNDAAITLSNKFVQLLLEEKFNVTLTFSPLFYYNNPNEFNLLIAAGQLPKMGFTCLTNEASDMNKDGTIRDILKADVERLMPNYVAFMADRQLMLAWQTKSSEAYFGLFQVGPISGVCGFMTTLRLDWMENLGITPVGNVTRLCPEGAVLTDATTDADIEANSRLFITDTQYEWDDFVSVLDGFVNGDPDGNGVADTYGLSSDLLEFMDGYWAFHIFPIPGMNFRWVKEADGTAAPQRQSLVYKEFLTMHKQLADQGLMIPQYWLAGVTDVWEYWAAGTAGAIGQVCGYIAAKSIPPYSVLYNNPDAKALMIPPTAGRLAHDSTFAGGSDIGYLYVNATATDAEYERALAIWDYMFFSEEGRILCDFGVEGVNYTIDASKAANDITRYVSNTAEQNTALPVEQRVQPQGYGIHSYFNKVSIPNTTSANGLLTEYARANWPGVEGYYVFYGPGSADALAATAFNAEAEGATVLDAHKAYVIAICEGTMDADTAYEQFMSVCNGLGYQDYLKAVNDSMYITSEMQKGNFVHPSDN
jgi:hypothetical protein